MARPYAQRAATGSGSYHGYHGPRAIGRLERGSGSESCPLAFGKLAEPAASPVGTSAFLGVRVILVPVTTMLLRPFAFLLGLAQLNLLAVPAGCGWRVADSPDACVEAAALGGGVLAFWSAPAERGACPDAGLCAVPTTGVPQSFWVEGVASDYGVVTDPGVPQLDRGEESAPLSPPPQA